MRLRLTVRRHALPEVNIIWDLDLDTKPTTSRFLESVNEVVPVESADWGLEDYAVELRDRDKNGFELIHFQPLAPILKEDDAILIRPLLTHDIKQRRLSGRHQISSGGKHLVDGIAFGRPMLRVPRDRPGIDIPPRKRRRVLALDPTEEDDDDEDFIPNAIGYEESDEDEDEDYNFDTAEEGYDDEDVSSEELLLLTNGEHNGLEGDGASGNEDRAEGDPSKTSADCIKAGFDDADTDDDSESDSPSGSGSQSEHESRSKGNSKVSESDPSGSDDSMDNFDDDVDDEDTDLDSELRDLQRDMMDHQEEDGHSGSTPQKMSSPPNMVYKGSSPTKSPRTKLMGLDSLDKLARLGDAFPQVSTGVRELALMHSSFDESLAYLRLRQDFNPTFSLKATLNRRRQFPILQPIGLKNLASNLAIEPSAGSMADCEEGSDGEETAEAESWISRFDNVGFPAGSITSGGGLSVMAGIRKIHDDPFGSSSTPKGFGTEEPPPFKRRKVNENGGSEPSPRANRDAGQVLKDHLDPKASPHHPVSGNESSDSSNNCSESDSESSSDESANGHKQANLHSAKSISSNDDSDDSDESDGSDDSDSSEDDTDSEDIPNPTPRLDSRSDSSEDSDSDSDSDSSSSSSSDSDSDSDSGPEESSTQRPIAPIRPTHLSTAQSNGLISRSSLGSSSKEQVGAQAAPPGHGLYKTQKRNTRRRTAMKAKRMAAEQVSQGSQAPQLLTQTSTIPKPIQATDSKVEMEARRQALLAQFAKPAINTTLIETQRANPESSSSSFDVTGRSMTMDVSFASTRPTTTATVSFESSAAPETHGDTADESWRSKIKYTAVECCHDGIDLSEPPFPFIQRWDPQQQRYNQNGKRGGKGKQAQRNQSHFYDEDGWTEGKKRKLDDHGTDETPEVSTLNYDDASGYEAGTEENTVSMDVDTQEISAQIKTSNISRDGSDQFGDVDDLPSLPADLTTLPALHPGGAKTGMVITWQQYILSSATNWQPEVVSLTATIVNSAEDVTGLEVVLAKRDLNIESQAKTYDGKGNRVYDRFEAIDVDGGDDAPDSGYRVLAFADMINPRILQQPVSLGRSGLGQEQNAEEEDTAQYDTSMADIAGADDTIIHHVRDDSSKSLLATSGDTSIITNANNDVTEADEIIFSKPVSDQDPTVCDSPQLGNKPTFPEPIIAESREEDVVADINKASSPGISLTQSSPTKEYPLPVTQESKETHPSLDDEPVSMARQDTTSIPNGSISVQVPVSRLQPEPSQDSLVITSELLESFLGRVTSIDRQSPGEATRSPRPQDGEPLPPRHHLSRVDIVDDPFPSSPPDDADPLPSKVPETDSIVPQTDDVVVFRSDHVRLMTGQSQTEVKTRVEIAANKLTSSPVNSPDIIQDSMDMIWHDDEPYADHVFSDTNAPCPPSSNPERDIDISISTERHHEISQLITNAGFRHGISPTVEKGPQFELISPSIQLQGEAAAVSPGASRLGSPIPPTTIPNSQLEDNPAVDHSPRQATLASPVMSPALSPILPSFGQHPFNSSPAKTPPKHRADTCRLEVPSSINSLRSGRQMMPSVSFSSINQDQMMMDTNGDSVVLGEPISPSRQDMSTISHDMSESKKPTPRPKAAIGFRKTESSSSDIDISDEFPSLETLSQQSRLARTSTPTLASAGSFRKHKVSRDQRHSEIMSLLDDVSTNAPYSRTSTRRTSIVNLKQEVVSQSQSQLRRSPRSKRTKTSSLRNASPISPPRMTRKRSIAAKTTPFVIPVGSQVIALSSSPEPVFEEDYRDDSVDETYELPDSPKKSSPRSARTRRNGKSLPAKNEPQSQSQGAIGGRGDMTSSGSQDIPSTWPGTGATTTRQRRKTSANF